MARYHDTVSQLLRPAMAASVAVSTLLAQHADLPQGGGFEGNSSRILEGIQVRGRQQLLVSGFLLQPLQGTRLHRLQFRLDTGRTEPAEAGVARVRIRIGELATSLEAPSTDFAANLGQAVEVFDGRIEFEAVPDIPTPRGWVGPTVQTVEFAQEFRYRAGPLVIDVEGGPTEDANGDLYIDWVPDAVGDTTTGAAVATGRSCGPILDSSGHSSSVAVRDLIPGQIAEFRNFDRPGRPAFLALAAGLLTTPIPLGTTNEAGCELYVEPLAFVATRTMPTSLGPGTGIARIAMRVPSATPLYGARFATQWLTLEEDDIRTSEARSCQIAPFVPPLGMTLVSRFEDREVRVSRTRIPLLRLSGRR